VYRSGTRTGRPLRIGTTAKTRYEDNKVKAGTTYFYTVEAYRVDKLGTKYESAPSKKARVVTR
jgi:fibronectin type 3 domain-containing protein